MNVRTMVEWMIMEGLNDVEVSENLYMKGYNVTPERVEEMREEMDISARGLAYEGQD